MRTEAAYARNTLWAIAARALDAVHGTTLTRSALAGRRGACHVLAIGKAACAMTRGALEVPGLHVRSALVVTKHGHGDAQLQAQPGLRLIEAGHPLPDAASFAAGRDVLEWLAQLPGRAPLVVLLSGGGSALIEHPATGLTAEELMAAHAWLLRSGLPIGAMNRVRRALSALKGGRLAAHLQGRPTRVLLLSDVAGDHPHDIASGPLAPDPWQDRPLPRTLPPWLQQLARRAARGPAPDARALRTVTTQLIGNSALAAGAVLRAARQVGLSARRARFTLRGDAALAGTRIAATVLTGSTGLTVWHGESTVRLPEHPGTGGRCRQLALAAARVLDGVAGCCLLALATDGGDGDGAAGACVDGGTLRRGRARGLDAADALERCDAGTYLAASGDTLHTGPTGTNVRDLVLGLRLPS